MAGGNRMAQRARVRARVPLVLAPTRVERDCRAAYVRQATVAEVLLQRRSDMNRRALRYSWALGLAALLFTWALPPAAEAGTVVSSGCDLLRSLSHRATPNALTVPDANCLLSGRNLSDGSWPRTASSTARSNVHEVHPAPVPEKGTVLEGALAFLAAVVVIFAWPKAPAKRGRRPGVSGGGHGGRNAPADGGASP
jgi:hypothetical protein